MDPLRTQRLHLQIEDLETALERIEQLPEELRKEISPQWLSQLKSAEPGDPWILGFNLIRMQDGKAIGQCGFKGPPNDQGEVEIAYAVDPDCQGQGFATEAASALTQFAMQDADVRIVLAHTLPEENASVRVLLKCGFEKLGEVVDPEDGTVWRFQKVKDAK